MFKSIYTHCPRRWIPTTKCHHAVMYGFVFKPKLKKQRFSLHICDDMSKATSSTTLSMLLYIAVYCFVCMLFCNLLVDCSTILVNKSCTISRAISEGSVGEPYLPITATTPAWRRSAVATEPPSRRRRQNQFSDGRTTTEAPFRVT